MALLSSAQPRRTQNKASAKTKAALYASPNKSPDRNLKQQPAFPKKCPSLSLTLPGPTLLEEIYDTVDRKPGLLIKIIHFCHSPAEGGEKCICTVSMVIFYFFIYFFHPSPPIFLFVKVDSSEMGSLNGTVVNLL